jgi:hypothetical protein
MYGMYVPCVCLAGSGIVIVVMEGVHAQFISPTAWANKGG